MANAGDNNVSIMDRLTLTTLFDIPVGVSPMDIEFGPDSNTLYVSSARGEGIAVVDVADRRILAFLTACRGPRELALTLDNRLLYVTCELANEVVVYQTSNNSTVARITTGRGPWGVAVSEDNKWVFVTNRRSNSVTVDQQRNPTGGRDGSGRDGPSGIVAASQPAAPIQFRPGSPVVAELPRTGTGTDVDRASTLKWIAAGTLIAVPMVAAMDVLRRRWRRSRP